MTSKLNILLQVLAGAAQLLNLWATNDTDLKLAVGGIIAGLQVVVSRLASSFNPDGSSAESPYMPEEKR